MINTSQYEKQLLSAHPSSEAEDWLVSNVCSKDEHNASVSLSRNFFLNDFSRPFLEYLSQHLYGESYMEIMGPYYEFISPEGGNDNIPYYKVYCFSRKRDSRLRTYVSTITARYFTNLRAKEKARDDLQINIEASDHVKSNFSDEDLKENEWFSLLIAEEDAREATIAYKLLWAKVLKAMSELPERERKLLQLTVMDNLTGLEAFEELADEMNSKKDQSKMSVKEKQKAVAVLKHQAIARLRKLMEQ
jgi:DNA-directed RNA polymerase specialized sigma24 family protein